MRWGLKFFFLHVHLFHIIFDKYICFDISVKKQTKNYETNKLGLFLEILFGTIDLFLSNL